MGAEDAEGRGRSLANTIGLWLSGLVAIVWVVYGMTGAQQWLLVVAVVFTMLVGLYWAFGRQFVRGGTGRGRERNRARYRDPGE